MSLNPVGTKVYQVLDPRVKINNERDYVVLKGSSVNSWQVFPATTINNSQIQITCNPPSREIIINRKVYLKCSFRLIFTGVGNPLLVAGADAPRAYPLAQIISANQMTINNDTITQTPGYQYWPALFWYHNKPQNRRLDYSMTPSCLDQGQNYTDTFQGVRNPLLGYRDSVSAGDELRGGFSMNVTNGNNTATVVLTVTEALYLSPFEFGHGDHSGMIGVQNMAYTATLGNLQRLWSHDNVNGSPMTNLAVTLESASLLFEYLTPNPVEPIPRRISYPYFSIVSYPTKSTVAIASNTNVTLQMSNVQLSSIPRRMYIYARDDDAVYQANNSGYFLPDSYLAMIGSANPLRVTWDNNQFFAGASQQDLYQIAVKNGCQMSWNQWAGAIPDLNAAPVLTGVGSILCIDFGVDLGLGSLDAPGMLKNVQLSLAADFTNINQSRAITPTLYVVVVYEGCFNVVDGSCEHHIGVLTAKDILDAKPNPMITYKEVSDVYGGNFFSSIGDVFRKGYDVAKSAAQKVAPLVPYAKTAYDAYKAVSGSGKVGRPKKAKGGVLVGGKMMSRAALMKRLQ